MKNYIIQTACAKTPVSWKWNHPRCRVAVLEVEAGVESVAMISARARGVIEIVETWELCYVGSTARCQYQRALAEAETLVGRLEHADRETQKWPAERLARLLDPRLQGPPEAAESLCTL